MTMFEAVIASEAKQSIEPQQSWIASSQVLLAMTGIESVLSQRERN
jgi:hypothetical protein